MFRLYYFSMQRTKKINHNKAVFVLSREKNLQGNLYFIYQELQNQLPTAEIHFVYAENKMNLKLFKELNAISNARYLIIDDYYLPIYLIKPNDKMKVIQLWHAAGAFKKFGHSTVGTRFGPNESYLKLVPIHANYTHVYVSSEQVVPFYVEAFNVPADNVYPLGMPRTDLFGNKKMVETVKQEIYERYPRLCSTSMVTILIAPTYRATKGQEESAFNMIEVIFENINLIKNNIQLIIVPHPYMKEKDVSYLCGFQNVIIAEYYPLNEWMLIADAFLTDYSSAVFDFSLLYKPLAHFVPDLIQYEQNRGLYQNIEELSDGSILSTEDSLVEWLNSRKKDEEFDTNRMIAYNFINTKNVSREIVNHFLDK